MSAGLRGITGVPQTNFHIEYKAYSGTSKHKVLLGVSVITHMTYLSRDWIRCVCCFAGWDRMSFTLYRDVSETDRGEDLSVKETEALRDVTGAAPDFWRRDAIQQRRVSVPVGRTSPCQPEAHPGRPAAPVLPLPPSSSGLSLSCPHCPWSGSCWWCPWPISSACPLIGHLHLLTPPPPPTLPGSPDTITHSEKAVFFLPPSLSPAEERHRLATARVSW